MSAETKHGGAVDLLAYHDALIAAHRALSADAFHAQELPKAEAARAALADLIEAESMLEKEFRRVYPIYYYAEPWAHETNVPLKSVKSALANVGHKS